MSTTASGSAAEQAVAARLAALGYQVLELNWKTKFAEIDIVAAKGKVMYFVEVKYRSSDSAGDGFDYITPAKLHHMQRAAAAWVNNKQWNGSYELKAAAVTDGQDGYEIDIRDVC
ncbi:MAG: YraN family protein [Candidatus Saccharimonadales bacterium]